MKHHAKNSSRTATTNHDSTDSTLLRQIAERAYHLFEMRGGSHGNDVEDWLRAEREVLATGERRRATTRPNGAAARRARTGTRRAA